MQLETSNLHAVTNQNALGFLGGFFFYVSVAPDENRKELRI